MQKIKWGIIGCGSVTELKSGPAFNKIPGSKLVAVMRRDAEKARDYANRHNVPKWSANADDLINDPEINAIYIATPPNSHFEYTQKAAKAGKAVYVEKPMALNYCECKLMIQACEAASVPLFVAYYRRYLPAFVRVKELIDTGEIGDIRFVTINLFYSIKDQDKLKPENQPWRVKPEIAGGGYFFDLASHQLDWLDYAFGPIKSVQGLAKNQAQLYPAEDIVSAFFEFESGVVGNGLWCFTANPVNNKETIEIYGSEGKINMAAFDYSPFTIEKADGTTEINLPYPENIQLPLIKSVVEELQGIGKCHSTGETASRTSHVMDTIVKDYYTK